MLKVVSMVKGSQVMRSPSQFCSNIPHESLKRQNYTAWERPIQRASAFTQSVRAGELD